MGIADVNTPAERALLRQGFHPREKLLWGDPQRPTTMWDAQQTMGFQRSLVNPRTRSGHSLRSNRPVPRQASAHFYAADQNSLDTGRTTFYFY